METLDRDGAESEGNHIARLYHQARATSPNRNAMRGLLDYTEKARDFVKDRAEWTRGLLGAAVEMASGNGKFSEAMARAPQPFQPYQQSDFDRMTAFWNPAGLLGSVKATKFEKAHKIAQKNAAKPVEEGGLGLPKNNTAADRAKALGFDVDVYHGANADINAFDLNLSGKTTGNPNAKLGIFTTPSPAEASRYPMDFGKNKAGAVYPLKLRSGVVYEMPYREADSLAMQLFHNPSNPTAATVAKRNELIADGFDSARLNIGPWKEYAALYPSSLRSRFAAFDPFRKDESDLLAGYFGMPIPQNE